MSRVPNVVKVVVACIILFYIFAPIVFIGDVGAVMGYPAYVSISCLFTFHLLGMNYWAGQYAVGCFPVGLTLV